MAKVRVKFGKEEFYRDLTYEDVLKCGGYCIRHLSTCGGRVHGMYVDDYYTNKDEALRDAIVFKAEDYLGFFCIEKYPGNGLPGERITVADLEEPVKVKKKKKKKKKKESGFTW